MSFNFRFSQDSVSDGNLQLIGCVKARGLWVTMSKDDIIMYQPIRAQEIIIYKRLLANHNMPTDKLDDPIVLNPRYKYGIL